MLLQFLLQWCTKKCHCHPINKNYNNYKNTEWDAGTAVFCGVGDWCKCGVLCVYVRVCLCAQILAGELCAFFTKAEGTQEKTIVTADCCYFNPLLRRIIRFLGEQTVLNNTPSFAVTARWKKHLSRYVGFTVDDTQMFQWRQNRMRVDAKEVTSHS